MLTRREWNQLFIGIASMDGLNLAGRGVMVPMVRVLEFIGVYVEGTVVVDHDGAAGNISWRVVSDADSTETS